ncbi:DUF4199 domain-containing protein [Flavobacterium lindanitolerans]|nr:DUF4199 domain-containing protein [Flavobacterium lindanitolerans]
MGYFGKNVRHLWRKHELLYVVFPIVLHFRRTYLFAGIKRKKTNYFNGHMDWKQGCATGLYMTIVIALLMPLAQASFHELIAPEFLKT